MFFLKVLRKMLTNNKGELPPGELPPNEDDKNEKKESIQYSSDNLPKNKEEWIALKDSDPILFADLTQSRFDKIYRENRELHEKTTELESQRSNLTVELDKLRNNVPEPNIPSNIPSEVKKKYSYTNLPSSQQEWEDLMIEDPVLGTDLRTYYNNQTIQSRTNFEEAQATSRRTVQVEHPDMYIAELDENGQPKKDAEGKVILKVDPVSGEPFFNELSEKGKVWIEIFNENPEIARNAHAPELLMAAMERKLRVKNQNIINQSTDIRNQQIRDGQVIQDGLTPPKKVDIVYKTEDERAHVQNMINRGLYKSEEEYILHRDEKNQGIYDENREPSFGKK